MTNDPLALKSQLCFPIYLCSKEITRKYNAVLNDFGLTYTQYVVMMFFWEMKSSNVRELGDTLMLDPSTLTPLLKKLESKGFLKRERSAEDERVLTVTLTEQGRGLREKLLHVPGIMRDCFGLTDEECEQLGRLTRRLLGSVTRPRTDNNEKEN